MTLRAAVREALRAFADGYSGDRKRSIEQGERTWWDLPLFNGLLFVVLVVLAALGYWVWAALLAALFVVPFLILVSHYMWQHRDRF